MLVKATGCFQPQTSGLHLPHAPAWKFEQALWNGREARTYLRYPLDFYAQRRLLLHDRYKSPMTSHKFVQFVFADFQSLSVQIIHRHSHLVILSTELLCKEVWQVETWNFIPTPFHTHENTQKGNTYGSDIQTIVRIHNTGTNYTVSRGGHISQQCCSNIRSSKELNFHLITSGCGSLQEWPNVLMKSNQVISKSRFGLGSFGLRCTWFKYSIGGGQLSKWKIGSSRLTQNDYLALQIVAISKKVAESDTGIILHGCHE